MEFVLKLEKLEKNKMYLWQCGFDLKDEEGKKLLDFGTTMPGGFPYIFVHDGPNKGERFHISQEQLREVMIKLLENKFEE